MKSILPFYAAIAFLALSGCASYEAKQLQQANANLPEARATAFLRKGMSKDEVARILGYPERTHGGALEIWSYTFRDPSGPFGRLPGSVHFQDDKVVGWMVTGGGSAADITVEVRK